MAEATLESRKAGYAPIVRRIGAFASRWPGSASALLGIAAACGFPPLHAWWIALPALALFLVHLQAAPTWRGALWRGWMFGWAHLTLANNWIATAFTYQANMPEWLGWLAVPLLCIYLAVYPALAAVMAHIATRPPRSRAATLGELAHHMGIRRNAEGPDALLWFGVIFAAAWIFTEWLRSWVFTGYPWPPLGLMLLGSWDTPGLARTLPWLGTYALSGLAVLIATAIASGAELRQNVQLGFLVLIVALAMLLPRFVKLPDTDIRYTLVQPLIPQDEINDGSKCEEQFQRTAAMTMESADESRLVLWPESAIPDYLEDGYPDRYYRQTTYGANPAQARTRIGAVIGPRSTLLTGVVNLDIGIRSDGTEGAVTARNSVVALNGAGMVTQHYAKAHLVPYGEYLPMEELLGVIGLSRLTSGTVPYVPGPGPQTLDLGEHGRAGIQVCYEIVFSGQVVDRDNRPDYLFNPSNDGWFGSWGPPQHLAQARMRAIEEGLPVLRSTTTGISAVIDADGMVRQHVPTGEAGKLEGVIPAATAPTLFSQWGNALPLAWAALLILLGLGLPRLLALRSARS